MSTDFFVYHCNHRCLLMFMFVTLGWNVFFFLSPFSMQIGKPQKHLPALSCRSRPPFPSLTITQGFKFVPQITKLMQIPSCLHNGIQEFYFKAVK